MSNDVAVNAATAASANALLISAVFDTTRGLSNAIICRDPVVQFGRGKSLGREMMGGMRTGHFSGKTPSPERVMRFNPPPTWPTPPAGWRPEPGWQPDPSWGPVPDGWQLWADDRAVAGWPPLDAKHSNAQILWSIALCLVVGIGAFYAWGYFASEPLLHDPVAVLSNNGGTGVDVALTSCQSFDVSDVQLIAVANANALNPGPDQVVWDFRPTNPKQRVFHLAAASGAAPRSSYATLASIPAADTLFVGVYYVQSSAPKGYTDRIRLNGHFNLTPSDSDRQRYDRAVSLKC